MQYQYLRSLVLSSMIHDSQHILASAQYGFGYAGRCAPD
jgi:hypothetical protein